MTPQQSKIIDILKSSDKPLTVKEIAWKLESPITTVRPAVFSMVGNELRVSEEVVGAFEVVGD